jgi:hypothetical protein
VLTLLRADGCLGAVGTARGLTSGVNVALVVFVSVVDVAARDRDNLPRQRPKIIFIDHRSVFEVLDRFPRVAASSISPPAYAIQRYAS